MLKALLLSASFGDGHNQVANVLYEEFSSRDVQVNVVDCFRETNQRVAKFHEWSYERITRYFPSLYGASYRLTANVDTDFWLWKFLALFSRKALLDSVRRYQPDIIIQLFPDHAIESLERRHGYPYIGVVITDFSVHSHWFHNNVDTYFIPNGRLRAQMEPFLSSKSEIVDSGIPIRHQFRHHSIHYAAHKPYVVLCAGGRGVFPDLRPVVAALLTGFPNHDVYVLCGRNVDMLHQVRLEASRNPRLRGFPYVEDVAPLFQNASLAIVKSGGITVSELLACECPMIFYRPQPGQEEDNAAFLEKMGAGIVVRNHRDLLRTISHPDFARWEQSMKRSCANLARPFAAESIVDHVLDKLSKLDIRGAERRMGSNRSSRTRTLLPKPTL
jgi:processive 1,2-diacylglycerol beta-glucosyltransferase